MGPETVIDWARLAEPQADQYDSRVVLYLAATQPSPGRETLYVRRRVGGAPTICDGAVAVRHCYPEAIRGSSRVNAPLQHPTIERAVTYLRLWPTVFEQFRRLMDSFHPLMQRDAPLGRSTRLGVSSFSSEAMFGTMAATIHPPLFLAHAFVQQLARQKLWALGVSRAASVRLVTSAPNAWVSDPAASRVHRVTAVLRRTWVGIHHADLGARILRGVTNRRPTARLCRRLPVEIETLTRHLHLLRQRLEVNDEGERFVAAMYEWAERAIADARDAVAAGQRRLRAKHQRVTQ